MLFLSQTHTTMPFLYCLIVLLLASVQQGQSQDSLVSLKAAYQKAEKEEDYALALQHLETYLQKMEADATTNDSIYIQERILKADFLTSLNDYPAAESYSIETKKLLLKQFGKEHLLYAYWNMNVADLYMEMDDYDTSEDCLNAALAIYKEHRPQQDWYYYTVIGKLGNLYDWQGRYEEAEPLYKEGLAYYKKELGVEHLNYISLYVSLATMYSFIESYDEAETIYLDAKAILERMGKTEHSSYARVLGNLGYLYAETGYYEEAEPLYFSCLNVYEKLYGKDTYDCLQPIMMLGDLYLGQKEYRKALAYIQRGLNIEKSIIGTTSYEYAIGLVDIAIVYEYIGESEKAIEAYKEAKELLATIVGEDHPDYGNVLTNLAAAYEEAGQCKEAVPLLKRGLEIEASTVGMAHTDYLVSKNSLVDAYTCLGEYGLAWSTVFDNININVGGTIVGQEVTKEWQQQILAAEPVAPDDLIISLQKVHRLLEEQPIEERLNKQLIIVDLGLKILKKTRAIYLGEENKLLILRKHVDWVETGLAVLQQLKTIAPERATELDKKAFALAESGKAALLEEAIQTDAAHTFGNLPKELIEEERVLGETYTELKAALAIAESSEERAETSLELNEVNQAMRILKEKIETEYPKYSQLKYQDKSVDISRIQATLADSTAIIEYVIGDDSLLYVFYIDQEQFSFEALPLSMKALKKHIKQLHASLTNYHTVIKERDQNYIRYTSAAYWLYQNLLQPILQEKTGIQNLVIITDGALGHLPFEAFLTKAGQQADFKEEDIFNKLSYLVLQYSISYNYSTALWEENTLATPSGNGGLLALAATYSGTVDQTLSNNRSAQQQQLRNTLQPLPEAKEEVLSLQQKFEGTFLFDEQANERQFKDLAATSSIIHLAMHGMLNPENPTLSSLAFTENKDTVENNFLQAYEVSQMELTANLVVLSACETGYGKFEKGNGIASLARAFMYAGVPALVVSLWQVNDQSTALIMDEFYNQLAAGQPMALALQQAKKAYLEQNIGIVAHPAFWSPFIHFGNNKAIELTPRQSTNNYGLVGAGILLLGGLLFWWLRRKEVV